MSTVPRTIDPDTGEIQSSDTPATTQSALAALNIAWPEILDDTGLIRVSEIIRDRVVAELHAGVDLSEAAEFRAKLQAIARVLSVRCRDKDAKREAANNLIEVILRTDRQTGQDIPVWQEAGLLQGRGGDQKSNAHDARLIPSLDDYSITRKQAELARKLADIADPVFEDYIGTCKENGWEMTVSGCLAYAHGPHVGHNSGENEWYTPPEYIEAARETMGVINLDPASSTIANQTVRASVFYTLKDDGLTQDWHGNVWMNPPYAQPAVAEFCQKLADSCKSGDVVQACVLVNNATETSWFQCMRDVATALCLVKGRVKFIDENGDPSGAPLQGQIILYAGPNVDKFQEAFEPFGWVIHV